MDTWPPTIVCNSSRKGKTKATILPYPLLEGGALTSATLREDGNRLEWVTAQGRASSTTDNVRPSDTLLTPTRVGRKLVCNKEVALAFPATQTPHLRPRTTSLLQRAEQGVRAPDNMPFCNSSHIMLGAFPSDVLSGCGHPRGTYTRAARRGGAAGRLFTCIRSSRWRPCDFLPRFRRLETTKGFYSLSYGGEWLRFK